jgi:hypothetical protein
MSKARQLADLGNQVDDGAITGSNMVVNGGMTVAQRGTSVTGATSTGYSTLDRWEHNASGGTLNMSQQSLTIGQTDIPSSFKHFFRVDATSGNNNAGVWQKIEGVDRVQGTVTLSFYAKGTNPTAGNFEIELDQSFGSSGSSGPSYATAYETFTVTSSWQRFTKTISVPDITGSTIGGGDDWYRIYFRQANSDTGTTAWTLDITGVCLNVGDSAIDFPHESYGDTLARCQRYYYTAGVNGGRTAVAAGYTSSSTSVRWTFLTPVNMRASPTYSAGDDPSAADGGANRAVSSTSVLGFESNTVSMIGVISGSGNHRSLNINYANNINFNLDAEL